MSKTRPRVSRTRLAVMVLTFAILGAGGLHLFTRPGTTAVIAATDRDAQGGLSRAMRFTLTSEPKP